MHLFSKIFLNKYNINKTKVYLCPFLLTVDLSQTRHKK